MRILIAHNYTRYRGGADESAEEDKQLLEQHGHEVYFYTRHNDEIENSSIFRKGCLFLEPTWSFQTYQNIKKIIREFKPDILHCHSFFPLISPSIYYVASRYRVPVVQTLHEYRLLCPIGWLLREQKICEECIDHSLWRSIFYGCYHNSRLQTAAVALMLAIHRRLKTWSNQVDCFISVSNFSRDKFLQSGIQAKEFVVRPNFLSQDPGYSQADRQYALYVGRLSAEKGIITLLEAWRELPEIPLKIIGEGPLQPWVKEYVRQHQLQQVDLLGYLPLKTVLEYQSKAMFLVLPSLYYETFGRTVMEAYATGTPALVSSLGALAELVEEEKTGLRFTPGDAHSLAITVRQAYTKPEQLTEWGHQARRLYESRFTPEVAYTSLMAIYQRAILLQRHSAIASKATN